MEKWLSGNNESPRISTTNAFCINCTNFVASGLVEGTTYSISVSVATTKGNSLPSDPITINTATFGINDKDRLLDVMDKLVSNKKNFC